MFYPLFYHPYSNRSVYRPVCIHVKRIGAPSIYSIIRFFGKNGAYSAPSFLNSPQVVTFFYSIRAFHPFPYACPIVKRPRNYEETKNFAGILRRSFQPLRRISLWLDPAKPPQADA
ncbi:hypothetical protein [Candidatus Soleaferrea massiliensis]|uniref:hypothetical protein n=1 Tax=Candidatus Soleaferrea massiliensis TaxID=1470354 RepID=UPI0012E00484|nr:hypothetical protein [Candidatus Soleaferrea massiliensis]